MKVVTSGFKFLDIDAYAGCIAYAELLNLQGYNAVAASFAAWNESIPASVRAWGAPLLVDYQPTSEDMALPMQTGCGCGRKYSSKT